MGKGYRRRKGGELKRPDFLFYFIFYNFFSLFLFQVNLLTKILKSFSSSVSLGCVLCFLCVCIFVYHFLFRVLL